MVIYAAIFLPFNYIFASLYLFSAGRSGGRFAVRYAERRAEPSDRRGERFLHEESVGGSFPAFRQQVGDEAFR